MRKIIQPARVIEIKVSEYDVLYIARIEAKRGDLTNGGELLAELRRRQRQEKSAEP